MDYVTRQFINLTKKFRKELRKSLVDFREAIEKNTETTKKAAEAQKEQSLTNALIASAINKPQSRLHEYRAKEETKDALGWIKLAVEVAMLFIVAAYATVSALQLIEMKKTTDTASRQLEMIDRPWIEDNVISAWDMGWQDGSYLGWAVTVKAENVGHSVATGLFPRTKLIAINGDFIDYPRREAKTMCDDADARFENMKSDPTAWATSVFPGKTMVFPGQNVYLMPAEVEKNSLDGGADLGKSIQPMLVGCIAYRYPSSEHAHHTWFVYVLSHSDKATLPQPTRVFFGIGKNIPTDKIILLKTGQFAD
jgi:hypothetical protein